MGIDDVASWYQKKIGTYDKQQWEKTVEQKILDANNTNIVRGHVRTKMAKPRTEFIDLDLIRGSSFPKAKPKHGMIVVTRFAILRFLFFPFYGRWWIKQTSPNIFKLFLLMYISQLVKISLYLRHWYDVPQKPENYIAPMPEPEIIIPLLLMFIMCVIHSSIVSTNNGSENRSTNTRRINKRRRAYTSTKTKKTSSEEDYNKKKNKKYVKRVKINQEVNKRICDEGFESFNGNGSSENGENANCSMNSQNETDNQKNIGYRKHKNITKIISNTKIIDQMKTSINSNYLSVDHNPVRNEKYLKRQENLKYQKLSNKPESDIDSEPYKKDLQMKKYSNIDINQNKNISSENLINTNQETDESEIESDCDTKITESEKRLKYIIKGLIQSEPNIKIICEKSTSDGSDVSDSDVKNKCQLNLKHKRNNSDTQLLNVSNEVESDVELKPMIIRKRKIAKNTKKPDGSDKTSETDSDTQFKSVASLPSRRGSNIPKCEESSCIESDDEKQNISKSSLQATEQMPSASEWISITTNSEECSYSSDSIESVSQEELSHELAGPTKILSPSCAPSDLVSCYIWENHVMKKADLSVLDISSAIRGKVESMSDPLEYFYIGITLSTCLAFMPIVIRLCEHIEYLETTKDEKLSVFEIFLMIFGNFKATVPLLMNITLSSTIWQRFLMVMGLFERFFLAMIFFFQLSVAERIFKQRYLYAKLFSHLTSSRKAQKSGLPHLRLNKVTNIKTWLSVRSYLRKCGPQRSVDMIVSAAFIITLVLLSFVSIELVKNSATLHSQYSCEACFWALTIGFYLLRFMTLGTKINGKYRNLSVLITEQMNLYLQIEKKPHKKEELMVANSVLKLATDLLKELESPFKISGLSANPYLYTITKLVILSALSGVFSEMLGFKLKLHKLSIK